MNDFVIKLGSAAAQDYLEKVALDPHGVLMEKALARINKIGPRRADYVAENMHAVGRRAYNTVMNADKVYNAMPQVGTPAAQQLIHSGFKKVVNNANRRFVASDRLQQAAENQLKRQQERIVPVNPQIKPYL